jgi:FeoB-associated Cys-rich membrane protein
MIETFQTPLALLVVAVAAGLLVRGAWKKRRKPGCGGDCGCPADDFKKGLKK